VLTKIEMPSSVDRTMVRDLNNPGGSCSFTGVEEHGLLKEKEKDFLAEIFGLRCIPQNSPRHVEYRAMMSAEE
jgi:hypothetical protein